MLRSWDKGQNNKRSLTFCTGVKFSSWFDFNESGLKLIGSLSWFRKGIVYISRESGSCESMGQRSMAIYAYRGKLGNGEHLSFEAYKYKENIIYVIIIMLHKEHINFYPETHFYWHSCCRFEVMGRKRRWRRSAITCIGGGKCERIYICNGCVRLPNFDLFIISLFKERILFVSYWFTTDPYAVAY